MSIGAIILIIWTVIRCQRRYDRISVMNLLKSFLSICTSIAFAIIVIIIIAIMMLKACIS